MPKIILPVPAAVEFESDGLVDERATIPGLMQPRHVLLFGRGGRGKSFLGRLLAGEAHDSGRSLVIADVDRTNPTLSAYFTDVVTPPSADDADVYDWYVALCEEQIERRFTVLLDFGGGDLTLKRIAHRIELVEFLTTHGVQPVAIHLIGPDRDDLSYLRDLEEEALFAPQATILVLNESLVPANRSVAAAFQPVLDHPIFRGALGRGAKPIWMPRLVPAHEIDDRRLGFAAAEAGNAGEGRLPIGLWNRQLITNWRRTMRKNLAVVADWLP